MLPFSEACERNKDAILGVLRTVFARQSAVLEIGSGTGQHAVHFAAALPHLAWQPSERQAAIDGLRQRVVQAKLANLRSPALLDVRQEHWPVQRVDAVFTANTLHIMSWEEVVALFGRLRSLLEPGAVIALYGPFTYQGSYTSDSNRDFDAMLRARDPASGLRDVSELLPLAASNGLQLEDDHDLPANNRLLVLRSEV